MNRFEELFNKDGTLQARTPYTVSQAELTREEYQAYLDKAIPILLAALPRWDLETQQRKNDLTLIAIAYLLIINGVLPQAPPPPLPKLVSGP